MRRPTATRTGLREYGVAKLANILFAAELARRLHGRGVTTYALHPGVVATDVWRSVPWPLQGLIKRFMLSAEDGASTTLYCATDPAVANQSGLYYDACKVAEPTALARDVNLAARLWRETEAWLHPSA